MAHYEQVISDAISNRYVSPEKTKREALTVLKHYRGLSPKLDNFVFNDGTEKQLLNLDGTIPVKYKVFQSGTSRYLLCLQGTIPISYKGSPYNIPICVWLLDNHPNSAPMVYVKPTADMLIKPSRHVDQNGKVYLPYLHEWNPSASDLMGLIQILIMTYSEVPPVYSKVKGMNTPYPKQHSGYPSPSSNPLPYPTGPQTTTQSSPTPNYPPYPSNPSMPTPYPLYPGTSQGYPSPNSQTPYPTPSSMPYPAFSSNSYPSPPTSSASQGNDRTITEEHIRASLVSAVSDRIRMRLRDIYGGAQAEVSVLRQQQSDLNDGKMKLEKLMSKMNQEQSELVKCIRILKDKEVELKTSIGKLEEATEPIDLDEAVATTAPIYKQILNSYAEDQATQDAIYYLGEALRRDVIDLDTYLKHVRSLSRKQFQLRAIMMKCRIKANLTP